ncbi:hypothetical protein Neosp_015173 [[Neocosmospora] mangrovei]
MAEKLHQISVIKSNADFTGFSIEKTPTLVTDIPVSGDESLYGRTFLQRSIPEALSYFQPDNSGRNSCGRRRQKSSEQDLGWVTDELNALSSFFNITTVQLLGLICIFGEPLKSPSETLQFLFSIKALSHVTTVDHGNGFHLDIDEVKIAVTGEAYRNDTLAVNDAH